MASKILLNTVRVGQVTQFAGTSFDVLRDAGMIAAIASVGGRLADPTPDVIAAAALAVEKRLKGEDVPALDAMMVAFGGSEGGGGGGAIVWKPTGGGDARTWAEVMLLVQAALAPVTIWLGEASGTYAIPAGVYDVRRSTFQANLGDPSAQVVEAANGVTLKNLGGLAGSCTLRGNNTTTSPLVFDDGSLPCVFMERGSALANAGTVPLHDCTGAGGLPFVIAMLEATQFIGPAPLVRLGVGAVCIANIFGGPRLIDGFVVGTDPTATVAYQHDGSLQSPIPVNAGFAGNTLNAPWSTGGGAGPTAFRPNALFLPALAIGCLYYDTTVGGHVVWNGSAWVAVGGGGPPTGDANALAYFGGGGALTDDPKLLAGGLDPYSRPQLRDIREGSGGAANAVWRQGAWQVDGDPTNVEGDGIVVYGKDPVSGLQDGANGAFARIKKDRFAIRLITGGVDVGYGWRVDLTEMYFKDNAGARTFEIARTTGKLWAKELACNADTTLNRPPAPRAGTMFFDTTIGKPVWWTGAGWVDATGVPA